MKKIFLSALAVAGLSTAQAQIPTSGLTDRWQFNGNLNNSVAGRPALISDSLSLCAEETIVNSQPLYIADRAGVASGAFFNRLELKTVPTSCSGTTMNTNIYLSNSLRSQDSVNFGTQDRTISVWVKYVGTARYAKIFKSGKNTDKNSFGLDLKPSGASPNVTAYTWGAGNDLIHPFPVLQFPTQPWIQYVFTKSADMITLYVDGQSAENKNVTGINTLNDLFKVGGSTDSVAIDDLILWNRALSATEVTQLYQAVSPNSIGKVEKANFGVSVFPNPTTGDFVIETSAKNPTIIVADMLGKVVFTQNEAKEQTKVSTARWANGVYLVSVESENQKSTQRLVINR